MGGFLAGPGGGFGDVTGGGISIPGVPGGFPASSSGNSFLDQQAQLLYGKIMSGEISDPAALTTLITHFPALKGMLAQAAILQANNFNPSSVPAWVKVIAASVPALATLLAKVLGGGSSSSQPASAVAAGRPGVPGAPSGLTAPGTAAPGTGASANPSAGTTPAATTDIAGRPISSNAILPGEIPPINPSLQTAWNNFLTQNVGSGIPQFPGQISATPNKNLTGTWGAFNPDVTQTPGADFISKMLQSGTLSNPNQVNPILAQMMRTGSPTAASSPLASFAAGSLTGPSQYLAPFLAAGVPGYSAPTIPLG